MWFTNDGGTTCSSLDEYSVSPSVITGATEADSLGVGAIAVRFGATGATDLVYVGTGEANGNFDAYFGVGIKRSDSGGAFLRASLRRPSHAIAAMTAMGIRNGSTEPSTVTSQPTTVPSACHPPFKPARNPCELLFGL